MLNTTHSEIDEMQGGAVRLTQHMRAIAYREDGILKPLMQSWEDSGNVDRPHMITKAPLMVSTAPDGLRRIHPTREIDRYIEIGAPFAKVGGTWTKVPLGTPTRSNGRLTWTRPNYNMYVGFGGHFVKLAILLKNGFVPEDNLIAFPVGISGLTRSGNEIRRDGVPVLQLRPLHVEDLDNPDDVRPITHQFTTLNSQPYMVCTLPALAGMSRPLIDPTLSLQPDATDGIDTSVITGSGLDARDFGADHRFYVGNTGSITSRGLIKFDLSSLPTTSTISSAILSIYAFTDNSSNTRTYRVYRLKRGWTEGTGNNTTTNNGANWNTYNGTLSWQTSGGFGANDCEQTDIGSRSFTATETLNQFKNFSLTPITKASLDLGNGWMIKADVESEDRYVFYSSDEAVAANRPKLEIIYTEGTSIPVFMSSYRRRRN